MHCIRCFDMASRNAGKADHWPDLSKHFQECQTLATLFDGITRHNPEGMWFRRHAQAHGFKSAVQWRDSGRDIPDGEAARKAIAELDALIKSQQ